METETARAWSGRASTYITILTALAVSLFFLGLGATLNGTPRPVLGAAGVLLGALSFASTLVVAVPPVHRVPDAAIERVVEARAGLWQLAGGGLGATEVSSERRRGLESAIAAADAGAALDPSYRAAQLARGEGRLLLAHDLVMATGPSDETRELTKSAMADYRTYLEARPEDYSAWWNLGWAAYLGGDLPASLKATERAIELSPGQLTLYLNRALTKLTLGDRTGAMADVEQAVQTAASAPLDSNSHFLAASDFDLGRLALHRPSEAEALQQMRVRLREALVALSAIHSPAPRADAPAIDGVEMTTLRLSSRGALVEGAPLREGEQMLDPDAVGIRLAARSSAPVGATLSARVFVNGVPQSGYDVDTKWSGRRAQEVDLLTPYGRAGFVLDPGHYDLELYVDGATRWRTSWKVPESVPPAFAARAEELVAWWERSGWECGPPTAPSEGAPAAAARQVACEARSRDGRRYYKLEVASDAGGLIQRIALQADALDSGSIVGDARAFFDAVVRKVYGPEHATEAIGWLERQGEEFQQLKIAGSWLQTSGDGPSRRFLWILPADG